jgi:fumarate reductase subunit D
MKGTLLRFEPLIWLLFGVGIMVGTILLTGWLLVVGVAVPLGIVAPDALDWSRASLLGAHPIGRAVLAGLIILPLWKGAHHLRHLSIDFSGGERDAVVAPILYAIASLGSVLAVVAVLRL